MILSKFDIQYIERKAIKGQVIVDKLAKFPMTDNALLRMEFLDVSIMYIIEHTWKMFFYSSHMYNGALMESCLLHLMDTQFISLIICSFHAPIP